MSSILHQNGCISDDETSAPSYSEHQNIFAACISSVRKLSSTVIIFRKARYRADRHLTPHSSSTSRTRPASAVSQSRSLPPKPEIVPVARPDNLRPSRIWPDRTRKPMTSLTTSAGPSELNPTTFMSSSSYQQTSCNELPRTY